ncbi:palmitoyltransferase hip14 [Anaeramoeba flamelloides]|uniref:Palmitoyltransferase n=1 Tax=Anaeramoeba flamelloides TaxID=1746091 RepID=A0AAV7ZIB7_9EUKA|nr:palmitoyltransferase hip14 [Anaeramoeba flamelloides]
MSIYLSANSDDEELNSVNDPCKSFLRAIKSVDLKQVQTIIEDSNYGFDINFCEQKNGFTPLHYSANTGSYPLTSMLIKSGAKVDCEGTETGQTPLHLASAGGHLAVFHLLIENGASPTARDRYGYTPLHYASQNDKYCIIYYLLQIGVEVEETDDGGLTALHWAAFKGSLESARLLINSGADINKTDGSNCTPLHWASFMGFPRLVSYLLYNGANIDAVDDVNTTPLECALEKKDHQIVAYIKDFPLRNLRAKNKVLGLDVQKFYYLLPFIYITLGLLGFRFFNIWVQVIFITCLTSYYGSLQRQYPLKSHKNPSTLSLAITHISWTIFTFYVFILPEIYHNYTLFCFSSMFCDFWLIYSYWKILKIGPGRIQDKKFDMISFLNSNIKKSYFKSIEKLDVCATCFIQKPIRSKHDVGCDCCVARFDHYCPWIIGCVGFGNHTSFINFLFSVFFAIILKLISFGLLIYTDTNFQPLSFESIISLIKTINTNHGFALGNMLLNCVFFVWGGLLLSNQLYFVFVNLTTNEMANRARYPHFQKNNKFFNPFNCGSFVNNFKQFFKISYYEDWYKIKSFQEIKFGQTEHLIDALEI